MEFKEAYEMPIGQHVEKKGKFNYLSWCYSVKFLRETMPKATWIIHENSEGLPFFKMDTGVLVKVSVVVGDDIYTQWHPVLNHQNKPIAKPNPFEINTSIQRCLTKAIGLATGIGLGLYAGEDLPVEEVVPEYISDDQLLELNREISARAVDIKKLLKWVGVPALEKITADSFGDVMVAVQKKEKVEATDEDNK